MKQLLPLILLTGCVTDGMDTAADPTTIAKVTIFDRLGDEAGPIAGLPGFSVERTPDPARCGGVAVRIVRAPDAVVSPADESFVRMLELQAPTGLDYGDTPTKETSLNTMKHWFDQLQATAQDAAHGYTAQLAGASPETALVALARSAQVYRFMASPIVRFDIPLDMRDGDMAADKQAAFCDALATAAEPLVARADDAVRTCVEKSANVAPGWWSTVCR